MGLTSDRNDPDLRKVRGDGQHRKYLVLSEEEIARGLVEPVRRSYVHLTCGAETRMAVAIAETYAREPEFYGATFCVKCGGHFPVGEDGEFVWIDTDQKVGTRMEQPPEGGTDDAE